MKKFITINFDQKFLEFQIITAFLFFLLIANTLQGQQIRGKTIHLGPGITKAVAEIVKWEALHPINYRIHKPLRRENELGLIKNSNPDAKAVSNYADPVFFPSVILPQTPNIITSTQTMWSNFLSIWGGFTAIPGSESGYVPPDCNGDVGQTQVITVINTRLKVFTKPSVIAAAVTTPTGASTTPQANILNFDLSTLFGVGISDAHIRYDRLSGRWFIVAIDLTAQNNKCYVAVSSASSVTLLSNFTVFSFVESIGGGVTTDFFDYPTLGIDKNALYIGSVMFTSASAYTGANLYVVKKSDLLLAVPVLTVTAFPHGTAAGQSGSTGSLGISVPQGVQNDDPTSTEGYFVGVSNAVFSRVVIKRVSTPGGTPTLSADINLTVPTTVFPIAQLTKFNGTTKTLDALDDRLFAAMMMKNKITGVNTLWTAHNIQVNTSGVGSGSGGRNGSRWYEIANMTTTPTLAQSGTYFDAAASNPRGYFIPGIAMSGQGHAILGTSSTASDQFADCGFAGRYRTDAGGTFQNYTFATAASTNYNPADGTPHRWGDFSQTVVDPLDNMTMWTFQDFATQVDTWGIRATQIKAPPPATPSLATVPGCGAAVAVTINGTSVNNSEFFDPGADAGGPGFNRLTITCSGGITVSGTTFVNPTQLTCFLDTRGKASGTYTITVTNPDGQFAAVNFSLVSACTLPVNLLSFTGKLVNNETLLNWKANTENNLRLYEIGKSFDAVNFIFLKDITARGFVNTEASYELNDKYPYPGNNFYRLKMIDLDGAFRYSNIVKVQTEQKAIAIIKIYPNPLNDKLSIEFFAEKNYNIQLEIFDLSGKIMVNKQVNLQAGLDNYQLNLKKLAAGNYMLQIKDISGKIIEKAKLVKQ